MRLSWKLGRISGIDVYIHATFLLVFLMFPRMFAGPLAFWNVLLVLAVFGCVLLHEFGHALMARSFGIQTRDITLYPIGGVARLERMPRAAGAELMIAFAGPAVNFAIALLLLPILFFAGDEWASSTVFGSVLENLLSVNVVLGLFNLIPAFPMDGGRVFRALLSGWLGRLQATVIAAMVGKILAVCFGLMVLTYTGNPIHLALAAFIFLAARAEEGQVRAEERRHTFGVSDQGIWTAPAGYRWVNRGNGTWQLVPVAVGVHDSSSRMAPPWL